MSDLNRKLTTYGLTMIAIGSCIGSGIFITPAETLKELPHYGWLLLPWFLGGLATFFGAVTFSELGARFPNTGGVYIYLKEAFGPMVGFLYGWVILLIINTGALAALGMAFADFLNFFIPISDFGGQVLAIATILILSVINVFGIDVSQSLISVFTGLKLLALGLIIIAGIYYFSTDAEQLTTGLSAPRPSNLLGGILLAFVGVFWSFGGWHHATYLSGETVEPQRTVPRAMLIGTLTVTFVYLLVILAYMALTPLDEMMTSKRIAGDAVAHLMEGGGKYVALAITVSIFGTIAIYTMSAPRIYYAMAKDGVFFNALAKTHPAFKTPHFAILFQAIWACILILIWQSFSKLITFVTFMDIVFMTLAASTIFVFRKKFADLPSFHVRLFPWIPLIYLAITTAFVGFVLIQLREEAVVGLFILLAGIPIYKVFTAKKR